MLDSSAEASGGFSFEGMGCDKVLVDAAKFAVDLGGWGGVGGGPRVASPLVSPMG